MTELGSSSRPPRSFSNRCLAPVGKTRRLLLVVAVLLVGWLGLGWLTVRVVTAAHHDTIDTAPAFGERTAEAADTRTTDDLTVRGWHVRAAPDRVVLVFSGIGGDRRSNVDVARHYLARGWSLLLADLRATGESDGEVVGLGLLEAQDVIAWCAWARAQGYRQVGLHGQSLGAAAVAYALGEQDLAPSFVALEACYDSIDHALANRLPFVPLPSVAFLPVQWFGRMRLGVGLDELRPIDRMPALEAPVLFVAGDADDKVLPGESRALFEACASPAKELLMVEGAGHARIWEHGQRAYAASLDRLLQRAAAPR